jgi:hypothetical protein
MVNEPGDFAPFARPLRSLRLKLLNRKVR